MARGQQRDRVDRECSAERYADLIRRLNEAVLDLNIAPRPDALALARAKATLAELAHARLRLNIRQDQREALQTKAVRSLRHGRTCIDLWNREMRRGPDAVAVMEDGQVVFVEAKTTRDDA